MVSIHGMALLIKTSKAYRLSLMVDIANKSITAYQTESGLEITLTFVNAKIK
jgi:hypothetical protein